MDSKENCLQHYRTAIIIVICTSSCSSLLPSEVDAICIISHIGGIFLYF
jgi:hypothetical protein